MREGHSEFDDLSRDGSRVDRRVLAGAFPCAAAASAAAMPFPRWRPVVLALGIFAARASASGRRRVSRMRRSLGMVGGEGEGEKSMKDLGILDYIAPGT